jgi:O-antigen/teichoic acid export membrane protein
MQLMIAVIFANSLWYTSSVVMLAMNRHQQMALIYLIGTGLSLLIAMALIPIFGLDGAALGLLGIDVAMSVYVVRNSLKLLNDRLGDFLRSVLVPIPAVYLPGERP